MNYLHDIGNGSGDITNVVVEVPMGSRNKYEYENAEGVFRLDRVLFSPFHYPVDYGFVPKTWYDDNDPIDAMVLVRMPTFTSCVFEARVIGALRMKDEKGIDDKLLLVPTGDPTFKDIKDITDVSSAVLDEIKHFFQRYKDLEGKEVSVEGWFDKNEALEILEKARRMYGEKFGSN
ncbi:MAG: inorganic diphosphatase [Methanobacteriota archaeon]|nr:MAG: inorganic diphosphatase [Euryarchaeota archaeon]